MMLLYDKGALDINDPSVKQKIFELFGDTGMMQNFNLDATRARMNVRKIKDSGAMQPGMAVPVVPQIPQFRPGIDDPEVHHAIATDAAKNLDFDNWPPASQAALMGYIQQIQGVLAEQAMAQAAMNAPPEKRKPGGSPETPAQEEPANATPPMA